MKLKNKLLPLIGTAAIVATATPLALTSCKSNNGMELIDVTDGTKAVPTIDRMQYALPMGQTDYTTAYIKACKENPEIFRQDFIYGQYCNHIVRKFETSLTVNYLKVGVSTPTFGVINVSYPGEPDVQYPSISFSYRIEYSSTDSNWSSPSTYTKTDTVKTVEATLKNVPILIKGYSEERHSDETQFWLDMPNMGEDPYIWQFNLNPWSIDFSYNIDKTINNISSTGTTQRTENRSDSGKLQSYKELYDAETATVEIAFGFNSYHLSAIEMANEFIPHEMRAGTALDPVKGGPGSLTAGITTIPHGKTFGLYMPTNSGATISPGDLSVAVFAGYDADGKTMLPITLKQVLPEESTATPVYMTMPTTAQKSSDWIGETVHYDDASYIAYKFPAATFVDSLGLATNLMPTIKEAGTETFTFELPNSIMVQFSYEYTDPTSGENATASWDQEVWLSQDEMTLYASFAA